ncbi:hypothetical protein H310_05387 [Aphanomyces invadans]|uniref:Transmembrane protein n=1 Tax=Aphanomyces invadans TaxID=157072 RepID=A0A024U965_9STRA|nr:hypothetical protein H310_05387 [Aphanomyces invadans]ETW02941.1 hypothetical protein H310_05387 [Aphanomyces invadans]|eukprot:XP_008868325.1 hypothetical protein H310_05387 [Aphanomyces invadans]
MTASSDSNAGSFHSPTALLSSLAEDKEQLDKRMQLQLLTIAGLVVFFLGIAIPFTLTQAASENKVHGYQVLYSSKPYSPDNESLALDMVLSSISTETYELSIATTISDIPARLATNDTLVKSFRVQVGPGTMVISPATTNVNTPMTTKIPLIKGSTAWYPFDKYLTAVDVEAFTGTGPFMGQKPDVIDVVMEMKTPEDFNWRYKVRRTTPDDFDVDGQGIPTPKSITVEVSRKFNVYAALVFVCVWSVTISVGYIGSCAVIWKHRPPDSPAIFVSALFAVPTVRNMLPGRPPYGCLFDILCTYFSIAVILVFLVWVSIAYMKKADPLPKSTGTRASSCNGRCNGNQLGAYHL